MTTFDTSFQLNFYWRNVFKLITNKWNQINFAILDPYKIFKIYGFLGMVNNVHYVFLTELL